MPGPRAHFKVNKQKNPNAAGGCLCSPHAKVTDCTGPYVVFSHSQMESTRHPHPVLGAGCAAIIAEKLGVEVEVPVHLEAEPVDIEQALEDASVGELSKALHKRLTAHDVHEPVK